LDAPVTSFQTIVESETYDPALVEYAVAGALPVYDLPDLLDYLSKDRKLLMLKPESGFQPVKENDLKLPETVIVADFEDREQALKEWLR
jgi:hypothetical protein